ncbi:chaplin [Embleya hyalina]|uniref:Membrane protein n=1 Tax=Embleya hyalina TaxID=516124 RepID=A0A401Z0E5_9ACTN|nr:membrane protein [Embleya hyalina]
MNKLTKGAVVTAAILGGSVTVGGQAFASAQADGAAVDSPGVLSGNNIQVPVHVPVNVCGNTVNVIAAINPTFGNTCVNGDGVETPMPGHPAPGHPGHQAPPADDCPPELPPPPHAPPSDDCQDPTGLAALASGATGAMKG